MGSLPNLHELERLERKLEKEEEIARREQRAREQRETSREREKLPIFLHPSTSTQLQINQHLLAQTYAGVGIGSTIGVGPTSISGGSGTAPIIGFGTPGQIAKHHHRHSVTARRVMRTRSSGASHNIWDDHMIEHLPAYSPISTRSHRINAVTPYQVQAALAASRRRESINSSIGATSIRRLLTLNNRNCRQKIPQHVRSKVCRSFTFMAVAHGLACAILMPLVGLQGSNSIWHHREQWVHVGPNIGSMLLSISFLISAGMCFLTTRLIRKLGYTILIAASYIGICLFLSCHLYPSIYTLIPAYVILGITLGPSLIGKHVLVVFFASKLSCSQHECTLTSNADPLDEHKLFCNRDQKVRRFARWFQTAQDLGIILGAAIASVILACTTSDLNCFHLESVANIAPANDSAITTALALSMSSQPFVPSPSFVAISPLSAFYNDLYNHNEHGERICGADLCPVWRISVDQAVNGTFYSNFIRDGDQNGAIILIGIYLILSLISIGFASLSGKIEGTFRKERVKGMADTLLFAGPMAYFIGTEQAYMLGDFSRAFVSCTLGLQMVAGALIGMGIMQSIVSCTLSMLLRHTKRIVIIVAGLFFHACLLLVLSRWKPSQDDSALFYVIAASWGACNAMWETLLVALVTLNHTNHVAEVFSPLQALRFLGMGITFAAHGFLCETPKIMILVIVLVLSVPPYAMLEIRLESQRKAQLMSL